MNLYSKDQVENISSRHFAFLEVKAEDHVLTITLDRAKRKNALHPQMVNEIAYAMHHAHFNSNIWMVLIQANGDVFCAGADLKAMAGIVEPHDSDIPPPKEEVLLGELFSKLYKPVISKVCGDVYAGGFLIIAGSHIVLAQDNIKLSLPEVKRGLFPFQVMEALLNVMPARKVIDWCIRGYDLPVSEALRFGLVSQILSADEIDHEISRVLAELKEGSPTAIRHGLEAFDHIRPSEQKNKYLYQMLMKTLSTADGREGLKAFREKRRPVWTGV